jgi:hypothetical protein
MNEPADNLPAGRHGPAGGGGLQTPLDWALYYTRLGWCIIPVGAGADGKKPLIEWKPYQTSRPTIEELRCWFANSKAGPAVVHGDVSGGLFCRDFDTPESYRAWALAQPDLAKTLPTVATGRGFHVYAISPWRGYLGHARLGDGELIGNELHYSILPPTLHKQRGRRYEWLVPLPDTPDEMPVIDDPREAGFAGPGTSQRDTGPSAPAPSPSASPSRCVLTEGALSDCDLALVSLSDSDSVSPSDSDTQRETEGMACASLCVVPGVLEAVQRSLPEGPGQRNDALLMLARRLKGLPALAGLPLVDFRPVLALWHKLALPTITTKDYLETWGDFCHACNRAKYPVNGEYMKTIYERAKARPVKGIEDERLAVLAAMCRELQADAGDKPFFLSVRDAAKPFDVSPRTACAWLWALVGDGYLVEVKKGGTAEGPRKATRWRYREPGRPAANPTKKTSTRP